MADDPPRQPDSFPTTESMGRPKPRRKVPLTKSSNNPKVAQPFSDKTRELEALRKAVVDAADALRATVIDVAGIGVGLWFSYLLVLPYLFAAVGSITHRDLFFRNPVKLPYFDIELPLLSFFTLGPLLFLVIHGYVLLRCVLLAGKVGAFDDELKRQLDTQPEIHEDLRRQLPSNLFVQILAGPREVRRGVGGFLLRLVALCTLVLGPIALLAFFLLQFLPYHDEWITNWHRAAIAIDLALLWLLWPSVARGRMTRLRQLWREGSVRAAAMLVLSILIVVPAVTVATFPGETLYRHYSWPNVPGRWDEKKGRTWLSLHEVLRKWLIEDGVYPSSRKPKSLWSDRLILPGLVIDHPKFDTAKAAALPETVSLRNRDLRDAVLIGAVLGKADLTGAQLQRAKLVGAQLQGASLDRAQLQHAMLDEAQLQGASLDEAQLERASLDEAQLERASLVKAKLQITSLFKAKLQGAWLDGAQLPGARLVAAQLQGASLVGAELQGALLVTAQLQGASLDRAQLQGASLRKARLQGASLDRAQLQGASLDQAQLQGASFVGAELQGASLFEARLQGTSFAGISHWRTDLRQARVGPTRVTGARMRPLSSETFMRLRNLIRTTVRDGTRQTEALNRIERRLNPDRVSPSNDTSEEIWSDLKTTPLAFDTFAKAVASQLRIIGCEAPESHYVLRALLRRLGLKYRGVELDVFNVFRHFGAGTTKEGIAANSHLATLAAIFLADDCTGARDLTEEERAFLKARPWEREAEMWLNRP